MFLFGLALRQSGPEGAGRSRFMVMEVQGVDVYSIYKETRSSDSRGARERHYAGWATDRDNARRRAEEIYEGRDSTEAVVVIGNGPGGVEVVYRTDGES
jgi:hypothetical protein